MIKKPITIKQKIDEIVKSYYRCVTLRHCNYRSYISGKIVPDETDPYVKYYLDVHRAYECMDDEEEKVIINNDYFFEEYADWWCSFYDKKSYKSIRKRAEKNFLRNFYEIHKCYYDYLIA